MSYKIVIAENPIDSPLKKGCGKNRIPFLFIKTRIRYSPVAALCSLISTLSVRPA